MDPTRAMLAGARDTVGGASLRPLYRPLLTQPTAPMASTAVKIARVRRVVIIMVAATYWCRRSPVRGVANDSHEIAALRRSREKSLRRDMPALAERGWPPLPGRIEASRPRS